MRRPHRLVFVAGFALVVSAVSALNAQTRSVTLAEALDLYERGDRNVLPALRRIDSSALLLNLRKAAPAWIKARGPSESPRRRLVMASFALEASADATFPIALIEYACDQLRPPNGPKVPLPAERRWHEAALAVIEAKGSFEQVQDHLWHLNTRFKNEPYALLADAWRRQAEWEALPELVAQIPSAGDLPTIVPPGQRAQERIIARGESPFEPMPYRRNATLRAPTAFDRAFNRVALPPAPRSDVSNSVWTTPDQKRDVGRGVIRAYEKAAANPASGAEARLRLGYLQLVSGKPVDALAQLSQVPALTHENAVLYLCDLFVGWASERLDRMSDAEAAFRRALDRAPSGRSAAIWLAGRLQAQGKLAEAQDVVDATLAASGAADPWPAFAQGAFRRWPVLIEALRTALWNNGSSR
jgi:tetratricopeptide (TPR) repeat protein